MNEYITPARYKAILKLYVALLNENKDLKEEIKELRILSQPRPLTEEDKKRILNSMSE